MSLNAKGANLRCMRVEAAFKSQIWASKEKDMLEYDVVAKRTDSHGSAAHCKDAVIVLDTDINGRPDAFNPAELLLAAIAACMIKGIERIAPMIHFQFRGVEVRLHGVRQDS